ncbi:hypothetical protein QOT17_012742 [Balamuthia mandrillaris]
MTFGFQRKTLVFLAFCLLLAGQQADAGFWDDWKDSILDAIKGKTQVRKDLERWLDEISVVKSCFADCLDDPDDQFYLSMDIEGTEKEELGVDNADLTDDGKFEGQIALTNFTFTIEYTVEGPANYEKDGEADVIITADFSFVLIPEWDAEEEELSFTIEEATLDVKSIEVDGADSLGELLDDMTSFIHDKLEEVYSEENVQNSLTKTLSGMMEKQLIRLIRERRRAMFYIVDTYAGPGTKAEYIKGLTDDLKGAVIDYLKNVQNEGNFAGNVFMAGHLQLDGKIRFDIFVFDSDGGDKGNEAVELLDALFNPDGSDDSESAEEIAEWFLNEWYLQVESFDSAEPLGNDDAASSLQSFLF